MKAVVKTTPGKGNMEVIEAPKPQITDNEVLVEVQAAGLCGTDVSLYEWPRMIVDNFNPPLPVIMGHEFSGRVVEVGDNVNRVKLGDRVTGNPIHYCGRCWFCQTGKTNICDNRPILGMQLDGCFAEYVKLRSENIYPFPDRVSFDVAAVSELLSVAIHGTERVGLKVGENVAVVGPGSVGLMLLLVSLAAGAQNVIVAGTKNDRGRLKVAASLGGIPINVDENDPIQAVMDLTGGIGMDVVFEAAGHPSAVIQSLDMVRKGGRVGLVGMPHQKTEIQTTSWEKSLISCRAYTPETWRKTVNLLPSLESSIQKIISHRLPFEQAAEGVALMKNQDCCKVLLTP
jgi:2-desacetyl-2-hydroxyethyl bacteriochlorophyllide A dehydrogenase